MYTLSLSSAGFSAVPAGMPMIALSVSFGPGCARPSRYTDRADASLSIKWFTNCYRYSLALGPLSDSLSAPMVMSHYWGLLPTAYHLPAGFRRWT